MRYITKAFVTLLLLVVAIALAMSGSPIYRFTEPQPFSGDSIFNPYAALDTTIGWSRANFHTHTKVDIGINECPEYPDVVWEDYKMYGYDILAFSNHNALTLFPNDTNRQIWVYEHGYNPFKFHKQTFCSPAIGVDKPRTLLYDNIFPLFPSQKQFMFNLLGKDADFLVFNHPDRTFFVGSKDMERVGGYSFIEAYCGEPTSMKRWDEALSAGHYSHCLINDDCHFSGHPRKIAVRCSWLNSSSYRYEEIKQTLLSGCYFSMALPDWADDTPLKPSFNERLFPKEKIERNKNLPTIEFVEVKGDTIRVDVSDTPLYIRAIGANGALLDSLACSSRVVYVLQKDEPYLRFEIEYPDGVKIFTNVFARCSEGENLVGKRGACEVKIFATIFFNALLLGVIVLIALFIKKLWRR